MLNLSLPTSLLSFLILGCAAHPPSPIQPRFTPEVELAIAQLFNRGCLSPDQEWVAYMDQTEQVMLLNAQTGEERWQGTGKLVYCDDLGVVIANSVSLGTKAGIEVQLLSYNHKRVIAKGQGEISGCGNQTYSPWPRTPFVGLEWNTRPVWGAAYPPGPDFDEEVKRCSATGALWVHRNTSAVESTEISSSERQYMDIQTTNEVEARINARAIQVVLESTPVEGEKDICGLPLLMSNLVARKAGKVVWSKPYGEIHSDCRP